VFTHCVCTWFKSFFYKVLLCFSHSSSMMMRYHVNNLLDTDLLVLDVIDDFELSVRVVNACVYYISGFTDLD